jgi:hypothetical protein
LGIPVLILIQGLFREVPLPVRFNRQRREVCVPRDDGEYWIVPWETVTAAATQQSSVSQAGRATMGLLIIGFENPTRRPGGQQALFIGLQLRRRYHGDGVVGVHAQLYGDRAAGSASHK